MEWLGLRGNGGEFHGGTVGAGAPNSLIAANDDFRYTFLEIADLIESEPEGLFA